MGWISATNTDTSAARKEFTLKELNEIIEEIKENGPFSTEINRSLLLIFKDARDQTEEEIFNKLERVAQLQGDV